MVRWRTCLVLAVLLLLPRTGGRARAEEEDDESKRDSVSEESEEEEEEEDDEEEDDEKPERVTPPGRRAGLIPPPPMQDQSQQQQRVSKQLPLECFVCSYKSGAALRSCLDPLKFRVHSVTCHNMGDKCFTTVTKKDTSYDAIVRGCRAGCLSSADTKCCEVNRCNNQAYAVPLMPETLVRPPTIETSSFSHRNSKATKNPPPSVLYFVTILLLLQTVVKVSFV